MHMDCNMLGVMIYPQIWLRSGCFLSSVWYSDLWWSCTELWYCSLMGKDPWSFFFFDFFFFLECCGVLWRYHCKNHQMSISPMCLGMWKGLPSLPSFFPAAQCNQVFASLEMRERPERLFKLKKCVWIFSLRSLSLFSPNCSTAAVQSECSLSWSTVSFTHHEVYMMVYTWGDEVCMRYRAQSQLAQGGCRSRSASERGEFLCVGGLGLS